MELEKLLEENLRLKELLAEAEENMQSIHRGEIDAFVVSTPEGEQIYTLKDAEKPYRILVEDMSEGAVTLAEDWTILYCNKSFASLVNAPMEEIIGSKIQEYVQPSAGVAFQDFLTRGRRGDERINAEFRLFTKDEKSVPASFSIQNMTANDVCVTYLIVSDQTERETLMNDVIDAQRMSAVGRLSAMIAHDLRGPLNTIVQASAMIRRAPDKSDRMLKMIEENAIRALTMIEEVRDRTREMSLNVRSTDLSALVKSVVAETPRPDNISLQLNLGDGMDAIWVDPDKMRRVLYNLLTNAVEAMPEGGALTVRAELLDGNARIDVSDTGNGIPEEVVPNLYNPFYSTKPKGMGLGLSFCKRAVEAHGGSIIFNSRGGKGTTFTVTVPSKPGSTPKGNSGAKS